MAEPGRRPCVLLVDDEPLFRAAVRDGLRARGYDVRLAASLAEARLALEAPAPDVVVLDQRLPDGDGHAFCAELRRAWDATQVIFVTAHPSFDSALRGLRSGADDYLSKPFDIEALAFAVERSLRVARLERTAAAHSRSLDAEAAGTALVGADGGLAEVERLVGVAAGSDAPVLITGETGVGKNVVARCLHARSPRRGSELVSLNCAALPESLAEAELFGHERGAFTGAVTSRPGLFELAEGGTLLLDEVGALALPLQSKLLGALEDHQVRRIGGRAARTVDFRVVAATNVDLEAAAARREFRQDLLYRLDVLRIRVPPLRERAADLPALCAHLLAQLAPRGAPPLADGELARLARHAWPGNVRELRNVLERALLVQAPPLRPSALLFPAPPASASDGSPAGERITLAELERRHVAIALARNQGNLARTARELGVSLSTLKRKRPTRSD